MKLKEYKRAVVDTPVVMPVFKVTKVPSGVEGYLSAGDEVYRDITQGYSGYEKTPTMRVLRTGVQVSIPVAAMEFVEYREIRYVSYN